MGAYRFVYKPGRIWKLQIGLPPIKVSRSSSSAMLADPENVSVEDTLSNTKPFEEMPGPRSHRLFGTMPKYLPFIGEYSMEALHKNAWLNYTRYGAVVRERILPSVNIVHVFDPRDVEVALRSEGRLPERRSHLALHHYRASKPQLYSTGGLLATNGPEWWRIRSTFQKNMTSPQSVKSYIGKTDRIVQEFVNWIEETQTEDNIDDLLPFLNRLFLEIIGAVAFDVRLNSFSPDEQESSSRSSRLIVSAFESNSGILRLDHGFLWKLFPTPLYKKMSKSQTYLERFASEQLASKMDWFERKEAPAEQNSLLDAFLQHDGVDMRDVLGMLVDILMAAVDTTSYSMSFLLYHVARNPQSQQALFEESTRLLPSRCLAMDAPEAQAAVAAAAYARCCVRESLRLSPVAVGVGRVLPTDVVLSGYRVPKGTVVVTQNMVASRLNQYCDDPLLFKPERWSKTNKKEQDNIHPFLSLPFGFGPRSCIARRLAEQTMCISLIKIVRNFKLEWTYGELDVKTLLINKPDGPVRIKMTSRNI